MLRHHQQRRWSGGRESSILSCKVEPSVGSLADSALCKMRPEALRVSGATPCNSLRILMKGGRLWSSKSLKRFQQQYQKRQQGDNQKDLSKNSYRLNKWILRRRRTSSSRKYKTTQKTKEKEFALRHTPKGCRNAHVPYSSPRKAQLGVHVER